jgi:hypothetical protein
MTQSVHSPLQPLRLLHHIISSYICNSPRLLATILPGAVSTMCKVVSPQVSARGGKGVQGDVVKEALGVLEMIVVGCFDERVLGGLGLGRSSAPGSLEELNGWVEDEKTGEWRASNTFSNDQSSSPTPSVPPSPTLSARSTLSQSTSTTLNNGSTSRPSPSSFLVNITPAWLSASASQLLPALVSIAHLRTHLNPNARLALASLASSLLQRCLASLESSAKVLLNMLLTLSVDEFPSIQSAARGSLDLLLAEDAEGRPILLPIIKDQLLTSLNALPLLLQNAHQASSRKILDIALQITAISQLPSSASLLQGLLGPLGGVEKWGIGLLDCLEFEQDVVETPHTDGGMQRIADLAWQSSGTSSSAPSSSSPTDPSASLPDDPLTPFPTMRLQNIPEPTTAKAFRTMLISLGEAGGVESLFAVEHFVGVAASGGSSRARSSAAVWCAERILEGAARVVERLGSAEKGKHGDRKRIRKVAKGLVRSLVEMDEEGEDAEGIVHPQPESASSNPLSDSLLPSEYSKGLDSLTTLLDRPVPSLSSSSSKRASSQANKPLFTRLSLSLISTCSEILLASFRPLLLSALYYLLSHLGSPNPLVRTYASLALSHVAHNTGYASPQNLVMDNVDYVINVVSQRLTSERLSPAAPLVLISMIRLVGEPIVPLVHDIVDEIFDALDDFHGYETICSTLLAVLDTLMKVMASESTNTATSLPSKLSPSFRQEQPFPNKDLATFKHWFLHRHDAASTDLSDLLSTLPEKTPQQPWGPRPAGPGSENLEDPSSNPPPEGLRDADPDVPQPTRAQTVCTQILSKALFFLTHSSSFIRARVLSLFTSAISVLGSAKLEAQLLPVINQSWPYILNRLEDREPFVVLESARVLEALAEHVGEFVSGRIRDEGWPKLRRILKAQVEVDRKAMRIMGGNVAGRKTIKGDGKGKKGRSNNPISGGTSSASTHSVPHRLYRSILSTLALIASSVPIEFGIRWEMLLLVRPFLDAGVQDELRGKARDVCVALGRSDADAVWIGLHATAGHDEERGSEGGEPGKRDQLDRLDWLREEGWDIEESVREIFEVLEEG